MAEFADNNNVATATDITPFYMNKGFHPRMSFSPNTTAYHSTRERLLVTSTEHITARIEEILQYRRTKMQDAQDQMKVQADKHRTDTEFTVS